MYYKCFLVCFFIDEAVGSSSQVLSLNNYSACVYLVFIPTYVYTVID